MIEEQEKLNKRVLTIEEILRMNGHFTVMGDSLQVIIAEYKQSCIKYHRYRYVEHTDYFEQYASYEVKN